MFYINFNLNLNSGGGNSFLTRLKAELDKLKLYSNIHKSKYIIINSHHNVLRALIIRIIYANKVFIHRVDGPIGLYVGKDDFRDKLVQNLNKISDLTIFQSNWSKKMNLKLLKIGNKHSPVIYNGSKIFKQRKANENKKISIIISSWSTNTNKGINFFSYLDKMLDFKKYRVDFYGNTNYQFKNIKIIKNKNFKDLEKIIPKYDLSLICSKNDPCSNFLIESINSNIDVLSLSSGGHNELIVNKKCFFKDKEDLYAKIMRYKRKSYKSNTQYDIKNSVNLYIINSNKIKKPIYRNRLFILKIFIITFFNILLSKVNKI